MTDTPTPVTPAVPEPVAYRCHQRGYGLRWFYEDAPFKGSHLAQDTQPLYSKAQMQALADRLAECDRQSEFMLNSYADENQRLHDRATTAEAALAEARKVIEPFARLQVHRVAQGKAGSYSIHRDTLRAARQWLSANPKETKG